MTNGPEDRNRFRELDRWVVGQAVDSDQRYIFHLKYPKLVARVLTQKPDANNSHAGTGGLSFFVGDTTFYDIEFFDEPPSTAHDMSVLSREEEAAVLQRKSLP